MLKRIPNNTLLWSKDKSRIVKLKGRQVYYRVTVKDKTLSIRSEEHTSELQSQSNIVCRLLLEKKNEYKAVTSSAQATVLHSFTHLPVASSRFDLLTDGASLRFRPVLTAPTILSVGSALQVRS